ncbi:NADPH-dependent F420 reductase [Marinitenerispora sediminis]|uniref:NADP oxidoreductase n=1 Tax=Marinitenerispora sediminis TaxID=1931232 RepID=A0A368T4A8_9ACTN|nr:NAD(P)-binding domain-containing protein [Marinitenerispora sediminis]RCV49315.1 NADP oxidoreductase [Marinitenerispora sediminis]RCV52337.1 NADP oxidoreductase [Marinitenerispora sediminis]RCV58244.1 NADP oxidoreductase [Marinitenerispora sediminis]
MTTTSTIAVLGTGSVSRALAAGLRAAGHRVVVGSRTPSPSEGTVGHAAAAAAAGIVVNALPGDAALDVLTPLADELAGAVLVDVANAVEYGPDGLASALRHPGSSLAEELQRALPRTRVVKTLNTMGPAALMADPTGLSAPLTAFLSGNDPAAKAVVAGLLGDLGWPGEGIIDLGDVATARGPEAFILMVRPLVRALGPVPFGLAVAR